MMTVAGTDGVEQGGSLSSSAPAESVSGGAGQGGEAVEAREAKPVPDVPEPSPQEVARHCLTHPPYKRWC